ncbi:dihydropteroate synthase [Paraliobacillus quinghaiensis]|uniref:Dihydropteroate synthase n=1 Tax=Paraliobacillus quinghaiensis TaxID=470815 RepID=A0A917TT47_9BACI|nr:dihydropteroate synthase [Paraliobacillus quinghaiensis]GGM36390.1 dihydropteroate synthase [Paraliobacillus quinghaiensis]
MNRVILTKQGSINLAQKTAIMGILNVTPDSFSDGGKFNLMESAVKQAIQMEQAGADIIDIGGESTRPGYTPVSTEEEIARVVPIIRKVRQAVSIPISIDTFKAETAKQAIEAGADIINDVWGAKREPEIAQVAATFNVPIILTHNRKNVSYISLLEDVKADLQESIDIAVEKGVRPEKIILDPGIGFAKSADQNLELIRVLDQLLSLGYPLLLGASRKSVIGKVLNLPINQRDEATAATTCFGITKGVDIVRVHNVEMNVRSAKMMDVLIGKGGSIDG